MYRIDLRPDLVLTVFYPFGFHLFCCGLMTNYKWYWRRFSPKRTFSFQGLQCACGAWCSIQFWETCLDVEYSLCVLQLKAETLVTHIECVVVNTTERRMGQDRGVNMIYCSCAPVELVVVKK